MSKREWIILGGITGLVLVGLAVEPRHTDMATHVNNDSEVVAATPEGQVVNLAVSGMT